MPTALGPLFEDNPASVRRLTLILYLLVTPVFVGVLALAADEAVRVPTTLAVLALIGAGGVLLLLLPDASAPVRIFATEVVPMGCCGIAYVATGGQGVAFLAIVLAPLAWAAVLHQRTVVVAGAVVATAVVAGVGLTIGVAAAVANAVVFGTVAALVAWVAFAKSSDLRRSLQQAETDRARMQAWFDAMPDAIGRVDGAGRLLEVHVPEGVRAGSPKQAPDRDAYELMSPGAADQVRAAAEATLADGVSRHVVYQAPCPDGLGAFELRFARVSGDELLFVRRDVTAREQAERESRFAATLLATVDEAVVAVDADQRIRTWSPGAEKMYGWTAAEAVGRPVGELLWPHADADHVQAWWVTAIAKGVTRQRGERRTKDGQIFTVEVSAVPLPGPDGAPEGMVTVGRDVTEEVARAALLSAVTARATATLVERETILAASPVGICMARDRTVVWANGRMAELLGYGPEELPGLSTRRLYTSADTYDAVGAALDADFYSGRPFEADLEMQRKDGSRVWIRLSGRGIPDAPEGLRGTSIWVLEDVTERRAQLEALTAALVAREQSITDLQEAMNSVRTLSGLLPICMYCKKIRNDHGYWDRIEKYVAEHSDARFSHGMCPDCYTERVAPLVGPLDDGDPWNEPGEAG